MKTSFGKALLQTLATVLLAGYTFTKRSNFAPKRLKYMTDKDFKARFGIDVAPLPEPESRNFALSFLKTEEEESDLYMNSVQGTTG